VTAAADELEAVATATDAHTIEEVVADKGYHSNQVLVNPAALDRRTYIAEPDSQPMPQRHTDTNDSWHATISFVS
jgi:hypothetical protein